MGGRASVQLHGKSAFFSGIAVTIAGVFFLAAWATGANWLAGPLVGVPSMVPWAAVGMAMAGSGVASRATRTRFGQLAGMILGAAVFILGAVVLAENLSGREFEAGQLALLGQFWKTNLLRPELDVLTAVCFSSIGAAICLIDSSWPKKVRPADLLGGMAAGIAYAVLVSYLAGAGGLVRFQPYEQMAMPVSLAMLLLAFGVVAMRLEGGLAGMILDRHAGGAMLRRLLPVALLNPPLIAFVRIEGQNLGLYGTQEGIVFMTLGIAVSGVAFLLWPARDLSRSDAAFRQEAAVVSQERALLKTVIENTTDAIFLKDLAGRYQVANSAAATLADVSCENVIGKTDADLFPLETAQKCRSSDLEAIRAGETRVFEEELVFPDGRKRLFHTIKTPFVIAGKAAGVVGVSRDITELKQLQAELIRRQSEIQAATQAAQLKDQFLSSMSHEFRTPLSLIMGYAELLEEKYPKDDAVEGILEGTRRLHQHFDDLITYSALVSGAIPLYQTEICLEEVIRDAVTGLEQTIHDKHQDLRLVIDPGAPCIKGDFRRLSQVVMILLDNASRFTPKGGLIEVSLGASDGHAQVLVHDTGEGMNEDELRRAWEPFGQASLDDAGRRGGLGLGLNIARKLVDLHGGAMALRSCPERGTEATLLFPALGTAD